MCPPSSPPIAQGLPGSPGGGERALLRPSGGVPDRMNRRQVDDVEAELGESRQSGLDPAEAAERARKELIPGAEAGALAVDDQLERRGSSSPRALLGRLARGVERLLDRERAHTEQHRPLGELARELDLAGVPLSLELLAPGGKRSIQATIVYSKRPRRSAEAEACQRSFPSASNGASVHRRVPARRVASAARRTSWPSAKIVAPTRQLVARVTA